MTSMDRSARALIARIAAIAGASTLALSVSPALAATPCAERVIADWSDDGRIDGLYPLDCYEAAIDAIPVDLRDYTNAADVIARALTAAAREKPPSGGAGAAAAPQVAPAVGSPSEASMPLPLIVAFVVTILVLGAGVAGHVARRHRAARAAETATD